MDERTSVKSEKRWGKCSPHTQQGIISPIGLLMHLRTSCALNNTTIWQRMVSSTSPTTATLELSAEADLAEIIAEPPLEQPSGGQVSALMDVSVHA